MKIDHIALYVKDLDGAKEFFETYFAAESNKRYHNPTTGLETYFLNFPDGGRLEIMTKPVLAEGDKNAEYFGFTHLAFSAGGKEAVDALTKRLGEDGYRVLSGPRTTGDGYYESCIMDREGNRIEIVE